MKTKKYLSVLVILMTLTFFSCRDNKTSRGKSDGVGTTTSTGTYMGSDRDGVETPDPLHDLKHDEKNDSEVEQLN